MAKGWYDDKKSKGKDEGEKGKAEEMPERHARERGEAHDRHAKARDDMHKQHEEELANMAERQNGEMQAAPGTPGGQAEPGAMNNAAAGAAPGTPAPVAGAAAA